MESVSAISNEVRAAVKNYAKAIRKLERRAHKTVRDVRFPITLSRLNDLGIALGHLEAHRHMIGAETGLAPHTYSWLFSRDRCNFTAARTLNIPITNLPFTWKAVQGQPVGRVIEYSGERYVLISRHQSNAQIVPIRFVVPDE